MLTKVCSKCAAEKPIDEYALHKGRQDGRQTTCRACKAAYDREYRQRNKDKINQKNRCWWASNPDKAEDIKERRRPTQRERWLANRDEMLDANRKYHREHPDEMRERKRRWYAQNPEKGRELSRRRRALKRETRSLHGRHTEQEWQELLALHGSRCVLCGSTDRITRDHIIPLSQGGTDLIGNIQPLCFSCNARKRDLPLSETPG